MLGPLSAGQHSYFKRGWAMKVDEIPDTRRDLRVQISKMVDDRGSIELKDVADMDEAISVIKGVMDEKKKNYRILTNKRAAAAVSSAATGVVGGAVMGVVAEITLSGVAAAAATVVAPALITAGVVGGAGILIHKAFTANPDYEVTKFIFSKEIHVTYKK